MGRQRVRDSHSHGELWFNVEFEWPLLLPDNDNVKKLSKHVHDIDEYVVDIANKKQLQDFLK